MTVHRLLRAIKHRIGYDEGIKPSDLLNPFRGESKIIILSQDEDAPHSVGAPWIELHPAGETVTEQAAGQQRITRTVIISLVQSINRRNVNVSSETHMQNTGSTLFPSVTTFPGPTATTRSGVLELAAEIVKVMDGYRFAREGLDYDFASFAGMSAPVLIAEEEASHLVGVDITMNYSLWRALGELA